MKAMSMTVGGGIVHLEPSDIEFLVNTSAETAFCIGGGGKPVEAVSSALKVIGRIKANAALLQIEGGSNMTSKDCREAVEKVAKRLPKSGTMAWGAKIDKELGKTSRVLLILGNKNPKKKVSKK